VAVRIHSTLTGQTEDLVPIYPDNVVRMYVCGLTPKFHTHVGHARVFVAMDVLRRYLEYRGYTVKYVQNFTDVDDKIILRAQASGESAEDVARTFMQAYFANMDRLNVRRADEYPTVTGYMERIVEFIAGLVEGGHAYPSAEGDVWFDVASFPEYGKLSKRDLNSQLVAARKELEPGKRDPRDFALWKRAKEGEPSWPSPWGRGRPGWHIECSAMARETLGDQLDIHGGGADLIFPHHENEIAQSESLTHRVPFVRHWAHAGLVTVDDEKMANSGENFFTLESLLGAYEPAPVRLYLIGTHYRSPLAFLVEPGTDGTGPKVRGVEDARAALGRLRRALGDEPLPPGDDLDREAVARFETAMDADFNTPDALAVVFDLAREVNRLRDAAAPEADLQRARRTMVHLLSILGIDLAPDAASSQQDVAPFVDLLLEVRKKLREARQWALSDEIRDGLLERGIIVEDKPGGASSWRRAD
jgi:cysteinyl-tRNA synthetase